MYILYPNISHGQRGDQSIHYSAQGGLGTPLYTLLLYSMAIMEVVMGELHQFAVTLWIVKIFHMNI